MHKGFKDFSIYPLWSFVTFVLKLILLLNKSRNQMEVEVGNVLVEAAVGDQAIAGRFEVEALDQQLYSLEKVDQEVGVVSSKIGQALPGALGDQKNVKGITWLRVVESYEGGRLVQALYWKNETHVGQNPGEENLEYRIASKPQRKT